MQRGLAQLLADVEHVGEILRLLKIFKSCSRNSLQQWVLIDLAMRTSTENYRYPHPTEAVLLGKALGLLNEKGKSIELTALGHELVSKKNECSFEVDSDQGHLLLSALLDHPQGLRGIGDLLRNFRSEEERLCSVIGDWVTDDVMATWLRVMQQVGAIRSRNDKFEIDADYEEILSPLILNCAAVSEAELWRRLETQRIRARTAEEYVVGFERRRLIAKNCEDLAELVMRISEENVSAGYDVLSYEEDGIERFIEVKSSVGRAVRFEWTLGERECAIRHARRYWIYFLPRADTLPDPVAHLVMLQNPVALINKGILSEETASTFVSMGHKGKT